MSKVLVGLASPTKIMFPYFERAAKLSIPLVHVLIANCTFLQVLATKKSYPGSLKFVRLFAS